MKRALLVTFLLSILSASLPAAPPPGDMPMGIIYTAPTREPPVAKVGKAAPAFTTEGVLNREFKKFSLADYRGK